MMHDRFIEVMRDHLEGQMNDLAQFTFVPPDFDPRKHATFRGKKIDDLTREELIEAPDQALRQVRRLMQSGPYS